MNFSPSWRARRMYAESAGTPDEVECSVARLEALMSSEAHTGNDWQRSDSVCRTPSKSLDECGGKLWR